MKVHIRCLILAIFLPMAISAQAGISVKHISAEDITASEIMQIRVKNIGQGYKPFRQLKIKNSKACLIFHLEMLNNNIRDALMILNNNRLNFRTQFQIVNSRAGWSQISQYLGHDCNFYRYLNSSHDYSDAVKNSIRKTLRFATAGKGVGFK